MGRSINANWIIRDIILQSNDNKKNYKDKRIKRIQNYIVAGVNFIYYFYS